MLLVKVTEPVVDDPIVLILICALAVFRIVKVSFTVLEREEKPLPPVALFTTFCSSGTLIKKGLGFVVRNAIYYTLLFQPVLFRLP